MDRTDKLELIARFELAIDPLIDLLRTAPPAAIDFRPELRGAWTLREHAVHFLDAETIAHSRPRTAVAEPGASVRVWDEQAWQGKTRYDQVEALTALEVARSLRKITSAMARALLDTDWSRGGNFVEPKGSPTDSSVVTGVDRLPRIVVQDAA